MLIDIETAKTIIKILKKDYGFTYLDIAKQIEVSSSHLYKVIKGDRNLKHPAISLLEKFLIDNNLTQEETINELLHNQN